MSMILCTICQDLISERPQGLPENEELFMLAIRCGHLFHKHCIQEWFMKTGNQNEKGQCPCCKSNVCVAEGIRIFPSGDEESSEIADKLRQSKAHMDDNAHLRQELNQVNMLLEETGCQLENERVELEIIKFEFTQKLAEIEELRGQLKDANAMLQSKEIDWQRTLDKANEEKQNAIDSTKLLERELENEQTLSAHHLENLKTLNSKNVSTADKTSQTDGRDAALLQGRLVSYKSCLLHMESEIRLLEQEYEKLQLLQPIPQEFQCYIDDENKKMDKGTLMPQDSNLTDLFDQSGDCVSMEG